MWCQTHYIINDKNNNVSGYTLSQVSQHILSNSHTSLSPIRRGLTSCFVNYRKRCTRLAVASDQVYQLLAHGQWFSPGTLVSSTTKNWSPWYSWNIAESGVKHNKINQWTYQTLCDTSNNVCLHLHNCRHSI